MADFHVSFNMEQAGYGFKHNFYWSNPGGGLNDCLRDAAGLAARIMECSGPEVNMEGVTIANAQTMTGARTYYNAAFQGVGTAGGGAVDLRNFPWTGLELLLTDVSAKWRRAWILRGVPDSLIRVVAGSGPSAGSALDTSLLSSMTTLRNTLTAGAVIGGSKRGQGFWCLRARGIVNPAPGGPPLKPPVSTIFSVDAGGLGTNWLIAVAKGADFQIGDPVHVHNVRGCAFKGINGDTRIIDKTTPAGIYDFLTLKKTKCCEGTDFYNARGSIYKIAYTFVKIGLVSVSGVRIHKTGQTVARAESKGKAKCCR